MLLPMLGISKDQHTRPAGQWSLRQSITRAMAHVTSFICCSRPRFHAHPSIHRSIVAWTCRAMLASARRLTLSCATGSSPRLLATALIHRRRGAGIDGPLLLRQQQHHLGAPGASTASHPSIHSLPRFYSSTTNTSSSSTQSDQAQEAKQSSSSSKSSSSDKQQGSDDGAKKQSSWSAIKRLLSLGRPELRLILFSLGALGINAATNLIFPAGMGRIIDSVAGDTSHHTDEERAASKSRLWLVSGLLLGAFAVGSLAMFTRVSTLNVASERIVARLRKQVSSLGWIEMLAIPLEHVNHYDHVDGDGSHMRTSARVDVAVWIGDTSRRRVL